LWGAIFSMPTLFAKFRTTYQTTFSVTPFPQTLPVLLIDRNRQPDAVPDACVHSSTRFFTQSGTGTVRTCPPLPIRSTNRPVTFPLLNIFQLQVNQLGSAKAASQQHSEDGAISLAAKRLDRRRIDQGAFGERRRDFFILCGLHTRTPIDDRPGRPHQARRRGRRRRSTGVIGGRERATLPLKRLGVPLVPLARVGR
jgi:hypothetical protein